MRSKLSKERIMGKDQEANTAKTIFATAEEARVAKPAGREKWKLWAVSAKGGAARYLWAGGRDHAFRAAAAADGYTGRCIESKPVNPTAVSGMLASLSEDDRNAILAQFGAKKK
jgi:hypothetical protein